MKKIVRIPSDIMDGVAKSELLVLNGCAILTHGGPGPLDQGSIYMEEQVILFVMEGSIDFVHGKEVYSVNKGEMTLLRKGIFVQYKKGFLRESDGRYYGIMFCIKEELIKEFLRGAEKIVPKSTDGSVRENVYAMNECLSSFITSLRLYFDYGEEVHHGQIRLKIMEMLYHLGIGSSSLYQKLITFPQSSIVELQHVVDQYYVTPLTLADLAELSGRSLSSFKRDFQDRYNTSPAKWIREKRLARAKEMLETTPLPVSDICFSLGFENISHFSRIFKQYFGDTPSSYRSTLQRKNPSDYWTK